METYKIGMIGTEEAIGGFNALGVHCFYIKKESEIDNIIEQIQSAKFAAIYITEDWAEKVRTSIDEAFKDAALPAVVTVPSQKGASVAGLNNLRKIVEQAVGSDILFNK